MLQAYKYNVPFATPLRTSSRTYSHRTGLILKLAINDACHHAEAAPLPGFTSRSAADILHQISKYYSDIQQAFSHHHPTDKLNQLYQEANLAPSLAFALDTLACQVDNHHQEQPLAAYLFDDYQDKLSVNALGSLNSEDHFPEIKRAIDQGYGTVKFKIGADFDNEFQRLKQIRSAYPTLNIRLDANRAWGLQEAVHKCQQLQKLQIEYCEEPLQEVSKTNFKKLSKRTSLPLSIDESVTDTPSWQKLLPYTSFLILKPMVVGSFSSIFDAYKLARYHQNKLIFTSSLELIIGRTMTAILAAGLGAPNHAHGLATGKLLDDDLQSNDYISNGKLSIPKKRNVIDVSSRQLQKYSIYNFNNGE